MQALCTLLIVALRASKFFIKKVILFRSQGLENLSNETLKDLFKKYAVVSFSLTLNVLSAYALGAILSTSECEW